MNLFKRKNPNQKQLNAEQPNLNQYSGVTIEGKKIKPVFDQEVIDTFAHYVANLPKLKVKTKFMCMAHSNEVVYYSLKAGAEKQGIEFNYNLEELLRLIDWQDYLLILSEATRVLNPGVQSQPNILNN